jgi:exopolysaccharide production protein ExoQ
MNFLRTNLGNRSEILAFGLIVFFFLVDTRLWPSLAGRIGQNMGGSIFVLALPLLALISLFLLWNWTRSRHRHVGVSVLALVFVAWAFVSSLWATNLGISIDNSITLLSVLIFAVMVGTVVRVQTIQWGIITAGSIGLSASLALWLLFPTTALQFPDQGIAGGLTGVYLHKNYFGLVMALTAISALSLSRRKVWQKFLLALPFAIACVLSASASAVGGMLIGMVVLVLLAVATRVSRSLRKILGFVIAIAVIALVTIFVVSPQTLVSLAGRNTNFTGRTPIWTAVLHWIEQRPLTGFGWGIDNVWMQGTDVMEYVSGSVKFSVSHSHNSALELLLEVGIVGLIILVVAIGTVIVLSFLGWDQSPQLRGDYSWILATTIGLIVIGYFEITLVQDRGLFLIFLFLTLIGSRLASGPQLSRASVVFFLRVGRSAVPSRVDIEQQPQ